MLPPKTFGTLLITDPRAAVDAMIEVVEACGQTKAQSWLQRVQIPPAKPVAGIFGCADDQPHPQDTRTLAAKEAKRHD